MKNDFAAARLDDGGSAAMIEVIGAEAPVIDA
jgi:hypothetical protein